MFRSVSYFVFEFLCTNINLMANGKQYTPNTEPNRKQSLIYYDYCSFCVLFYFLTVSESNHQMNGR